MAFSQDVSAIHEYYQRDEVRKSKGIPFRLLNPSKWKNFMIRVLEDLKEEGSHDQVIIEGLRKTVANMSEEMFIEIIMRLQGLKLSNRREGRSKSAFYSERERLPIRSAEQIQETNSSQDSTSEGVFHERWSQNRQTHQLYSLLWKEQALSKQFNYPGHPFGRVVQKYCLLVEVKYKCFLQRYIKNKREMTLADFGELVRKDYLLLETFLRNSVLHLGDMFKISEKNHKKEFSRRLVGFICRWMRRHKSIGIFRTIMRSFARISPENKAIQANIPDRVEIQMFEVPERLAIEGCYVYSLNVFLEFCGCNDAVQALQLLANLRKSVYKDVDEYYTINKMEGSKVKEVDVESQIQIFRFLACKMKIFSWQILGELKYLDVVYGDAICSEFDQASCIHSQLSVALEAIQKKL